MRILIVADHRDLRVAMRRLLRNLPDAEIVEADSRASALAALSSPIDLCLLDVRLSDDPNDRSGLALLAELRRTARDVPVVIVSSSSALKDAREAMRLGARDYVLEDELCEEMLVPIVNTFRERSALSDEIVRLRARLDRDFGVEALVGSSPAMDRLRRSIVRVAASDVPVLVVGETGTGKERVARAIHQTSARRDEPFVGVNCTALPGTLLESLLFGHERGAFTGADRRAKGRIAAAGAGTLLLDEIGDLPLDLQGKLLRVLEEGRYLPVGADEELPVRARIVAATNVDLQARVRAGQFRSDLFYRLEVVTLRTPSLAERGADDLAELLEAFAAEQPRTIRFTERAVAWLAARRWPGNVRELKNFVRRASIMADEEVVDVAALAELVRTPPAAAGSALDALVDAVLAAPGEGGSRWRAIERAILRRALDQAGGNRAAAARALGMSRQALVRRWTRLEDEPDEED